MEGPSFSGEFIQREFYCVFQIQLFRKRLNKQMAAVMLQVISSATQYSKSSLFIPANTCEKFIVRKDFSLAQHADKMCFLLICRYHILLLGDFEVLLQTLHAIWFFYENVDCLYSFSRINSVTKLLPRVYKCSISCREVYCNPRTKRVDRIPS